MTTAHSSGQCGKLCREPRARGRELTRPGALTVVLLFQPAQDPEDPSFRDFQAVWLLGGVGKLLPGPQLAYGRLHLPGLTGTFLQLLLVIAGEAASTQLSLVAFYSPSSPLAPSEPLSCVASSGAGTQAQDLGDLGFSPLLCHSLPVTVGKSLPCFGLQSPPKGNGYLYPVTASHLTSLGFRCPLGKTDPFSRSRIK